MLLGQPLGALLGALFTSQKNRSVRSAAATADVVSSRRLLLFATAGLELNISLLLTTLLGSARLTSFYQAEVELLRGSFPHWHGRAIVDPSWRTSVPTAGWRFLFTAVWHSYSRSELDSRIYLPTQATRQNQCTSEPKSNRARLQLAHVGERPCHGGCSRACKASMAC